ncbi:hypothetical protein OHR01_002859 [Salmonella enterica]|nr:hypothetical protein [Salmonella enterica]EKG3678622.1 hypothetical protein [Salmonella enterica]
MDLSDGAPVTTSRGGCRGRTQKFLTPAAKSFVAGTSPPGRLKRDVVTSAPGKSGCGEQAAEVAAGGQTAAPSGAVTLYPARGAGSAVSGATGADEQHYGARKFS